MTPTLDSQASEIGGQLLQRLADRGARATKARATVLRALASRAEGFTIEELCRDTKTVGRATVYRTVGLLVKEGLVCKLAMDNAVPRYTLAPPGHHHHAVCVLCGTISDFRGCDLGDLVQRLAKTAHSELIGHRLEVYVVCAQCKLATSRRAPTSRPRLVAQ